MSLVSQDARQETSSKHFTATTVHSCREKDRDRRKQREIEEREVACDTVRERKEKGREMNNLRDEVDVGRRRGRVSVAGRH